MKIFISFQGKPMPERVRQKMRARKTAASTAADACGLRQ